VRLQPLGHLSGERILTEDPLRAAKSKKPALRGPFAGLAGARRHRKTCCYVCS
jgi:hypothetical protein